MCLASCGGVRWQLCAESGMVLECSPPPAAASMAAGHRLRSSAGAGQCAPEIHRSCRFDLGDHSLGAADLQCDSLHWEKLNFAKGGKQGFKGTAVCYSRRNLTWWLKANFSKQLVSSVLII